MMRMIINGIDLDLEATTLLEVVEHYELQEKMVVTEVDGVIVDRDDWATTPVQEGMKIELVHFVGGG